MGGGQGVGHERGRPAGSAGEPQDIQEAKIDTQRGHVGGVGGGGSAQPAQPESPKTLNKTKVTLNRGGVKYQ